MNWGNNDSEHSKPKWLTEEQKRHCIRTVRGWEVPLAGCSITGATYTYLTGGTVYKNDSNFNIPMELLVALPMDASPTGATNPNLVPEFRGLTQSTLTSGEPNYRPYFTTPLTGSTITITRGTTAFIPLIFVDPNTSDSPHRVLMSATGTTVSSAAYRWQLITATGFSAGYFASDVGITRSIAWFNQPTSLTGNNATGYYDRLTNTSIALNQFGGWGGITSCAGILVIGITALGPAGAQTFGIDVNDARGGGSLTGSTRFTVIAV